MNSKSFVRWCRIIHRDLGYLMVGLCLVYALSGIILNHMGGDDPAYTTEKNTIRIQPGLSPEELSRMWTSNEELPVIKKVLPLNDGRVRLLCEGGLGEYEVATGDVVFEIYKKRAFVYWINKMHYNQLKGWVSIADFFSVSLIFFALSGLVIVKGKNGLAGRGKWFLLIGLLIPLLYILIGS